MTGSSTSRPSGEPLVSVVMPVRNAGAYLAVATDSVLRQTYRNLELLLIDDGSVDGCLDSLRQMADPRVYRLGDSRSLGVTARLNEGIAAARGEFIARMDADDVCAPERIERQVSAMQSDERLAVIGTAAAYIDDRGRITGVTRRAPEGDLRIRWRLLTDNCIVHPSVMIRTSIAKAEGYCASYPLAQDYELWLRLAARGHRLAVLPEVLLLLRRHSGAVTATRRQQQLELAAGAFIGHCGSAYGLLVGPTLGRALVEPPAFRSNGAPREESPFALLQLLLVRFRQREPAADDRGFRRFAGDDIAVYAARYLARGLLRRPPGRRLREIADARTAVGTVLQHAPTLLLETWREFNHRRLGKRRARELVQLTTRRE